MAELLEQVLTELDHAVGELQRVQITIRRIAGKTDGKEAELFARILACIDNRIKSGKATMMLAGYTPITYRDKDG